MKRKWLVVIGIVVVLLFSGCAQETQEAMEDTIVIREETIEVSSGIRKLDSRRADFAPIATLSLATKTAENFSPDSNKDCIVL